MTSDLRVAVRRRRPDRRLAQIRPRPRHQLVEWNDFIRVDQPRILLDTNVYINRAAGRLPILLRDMIGRALLFHCTVALSELAVGVAHADQTRPDWEALRDHYIALFDTIPSVRLLTPEPQIWTEAGLVAGTLARTQGFQPHQRKDCLNDALIYLTAAKAGLPVLTANRDEFDLIQQIAPEGRFIHY